MKLVKLVSTLSLAGISLLFGDDNSCYSTSFENFPSGSITEFADGEGVWITNGTAEVYTKHKKSGVKSLYLKGGKSATYEVNLDGGARNSRGVEFYAERFTNRAPFEFLVKIKYDDQWYNLANLSSVVVSGRELRSHVALKFPEGKQITNFQFIITAPVDGGVLIDDFKLLKEEPSAETNLPLVATDLIAKKLVDQPLFISGTDNCHTYRIPAIITAMNGDLIAAADARYKSGADLKWVRDIDIVIRRSSDNGKSWSDIEKVGAFGSGRPASDPSFILNDKTGDIFLMYNYMDQDKSKGEFRFYVQKSSDNGRTWSEATDFTDAVSLPGWGKLDFKFITSGRGFTTKSGKMVHTLVHLKHGVYIIYSDDNGKSWQVLPNSVKPADESKIIELSDGSWMINSRVNGAGFRWVHRSSDEGKSWKSEKELQLVDPSCNASIIRYTSKNDGYSKDRLLYSSANSNNGRRNLTVKISYDEGKSWSIGKVVDAGAAAYSDLTILRDGTIGILYEPGYKEVRFTSITLEDLTDGGDKLEKPYQVK
ncbi:MAG: sialidase family protein [Lentisphaeria bacterium]